MDDDARSAARRRAWIAFGLAGALLVVNVVAAFAWREERRDRLDGARIEIERRLDEGFGDAPWERGDGRGADDDLRGPGAGRQGSGSEGGDTGRGDADRPRRGPFSQGEPGSGRGGTGSDGQDGTTQDGGDEQGGTA
jgi:hypothetical protein